MWCYSAWNNAHVLLTIKQHIKNNWYTLFINSFIKFSGMSYPTSKFICTVAAYSASSYSIQMKQTKYSILNTIKWHIQHNIMYTCFVRQKTIPSPTGVLFTVLGLPAKESWMKHLEELCMDTANHRSCCGLLMCPMGNQFTSMVSGVVVQTLFKRPMFL